MTWSYCLHRRYSMSRRKNSILMVEHALNCEPVPLRPITFKFGNFINFKTFFPGWCQRLFRPQLVYVKSWKKPWKGHLIKSACVNTRESRASIREKLHHCQRAETWQTYTRQLLQIYYLNADESCDEHGVYFGGWLKWRAMFITFLLSGNDVISLELIFVYLYTRINRRIPYKKQISWRILDRRWSRKWKTLRGKSCFV